MPPETKRYLYDIQHAAELLTEFIAGKTFSDYTSDPLLRSATERQFGIIGEAVTQLANLDLPTASRITEYRRIIAFRNILIHQYAAVDDQVVWGVLQTQLPTLSLEIQALLLENNCP